MPIVWLWHYLLNCQLGCQWLESRRHNSQLPPSVSMAWDIIECVAWEEGIFLAVDHNVVPNVDKVKYMGIALHRILHCQSNNTKPNKLLAMAQIIQYHGKI